MRFTGALKKAFRGIGSSISRFPLSLLFLIAMAVLNSIEIEQPRTDYTRFLFTFAVGTLLSVVGQIVSERFTLKPPIRYLIMAGAAVLTLGYFFILTSQTPYNIEITVKTSAVLFALVVAFIWVPTINHPYVTFHRNVLAFLKALFITILTALILSAGISAIFFAIDSLLFRLDYDLISHLLNYVWVLFAPIYFLSLTPDFKQLPEHETTEEASLVREFSVPRFLEVLLIYIVIPLTVLYTLILVAYIVINIRGDFWTDNLLEPLLVSYAIISLIVLILSYNLDHKYAQLFRQIFPKILLPIVIFQTIASILKIQEMGITHGRYYVIMFGVFTTIAAVLFSFMKPKFHGLSAVVLLVLAVISIVPPIDAFTVSRRNQINLLTEKLTANNILQDNTLVPNDDVSTEDRMTITQLVSYIDRLDYTEQVDYLPENFRFARDFSDTFGFDRTYEYGVGTDPSSREYIYLTWMGQQAVNIEPFNVLFYIDLFESFDDTGTDPLPFQFDNQDFVLEKKFNDGYLIISLNDSDGDTLLTYNFEELFDSYFDEDFTSTFTGVEKTVEEATVTVENEQVRMDIMVQTLNRTENFIGGDAYLFIEFK